MEEFDSFNADVVLLSPPCQPFTRVGRQRDVSDPRSQSLLHILGLLTKSVDYIGCVHKVAQSNPGSDAQITGFQPTFTNALCNDSSLIEWLVADLTSVVNLLQRPEWY